MPTLLNRGLTWLASRLETSAGRSVKLTRGALESSTLTGTATMREYEVVDEDGVGTVHQVWEWVFTTADLPWAPQRGDTIRETLGGVAYEYQILPIAGRPAVEWLDTEGVMTMTRTKRIS